MIYLIIFQYMKDCLAIEYIVRMAKVYVTGEIL